MNKLALSIALLALSPTPVLADRPAAASAQEVDAARKTFKFKGQWIHPSLVREFLPWVSDHDRPLVTGVDVAAATGTNRYSEDVTEAEGGASTVVEGGTTVAYEWKGRLKSGAHVLVVTQAGDGTMVQTLLFVGQLVGRWGTDGEGRRYQQLILEPVRLVTLGDRAQVRVSVVGNSVDVDVQCEKTCDPKRLRLTF